MNLGKAVAAMCRQFKTDDAVVAEAGKLFKAGEQHLEAIVIICAYEKPHELLSARRYG